MQQKVPSKISLVHIDLGTDVIKASAVVCITASHKYVNQLEEKTSKISSKWTIKSIVNTCKDINDLLQHISYHEIELPLHIIKIVECNFEGRIHG